ncbi:hypothetical protein D3C86_2013330 [compost metagenome]
MAVSKVATSKGTNKEGRQDKAERQDQRHLHLVTDRISETIQTIQPTGLISGTTNQGLLLADLKKSLRKKKYRIRLKQRLHV